MATNPLVGTSWSASPLPNPGLFSGPQLPPTFGKVNQNPYGQGSRGGGDLSYNLAQTNLQTGLQRNQLAPLFAQMMFGAAGPAKDFYAKLMDLGSPFYKQKQTEAFTQGVQQNENAAGQARQQLQAQGYGATPSGATAAMIGGMNQAGAKSLAEQYLENLFQNENLQLQGAQGLSQLASLFNPSSLLTSNINPSIQQPTNTAAEDMGAVGQLMAGLFGGGGVSAKGRF